MICHHDEGWQSCIYGYILIIDVLESESSIHSQSKSDVAKCQTVHNLSLALFCWFWPSKIMFLGRAHLMANIPPNRLNSTDSPTSPHLSISPKNPGFILICWHILKTLPMFCQVASVTNGWFTLVWVLGSHGAEVYLEEDKTLGFMDWWPVTSALCAANTNLATPQQPQINGISWGIQP